LRERVLLAKNKVVLACAACLAVLWFVACLPFVVVLLEFGRVGLCPDGRMLGWFIATLYGSFFLFPVFIGDLLAVALVLPLATTVTLARGKRSGKVLLGFWLITSALICALEFCFSPGALFEVRPDVMAAHPAFLAGLRGAACQDQTFRDFSSQLAPLVALGRSWTGLVYYPGFAALTLLQNTMFVVLAAFIFYKREVIEQRAPYLKGAIFYILGYAMFLGSIWCLFRLSYRNDMPRLFALNNPLAGDYAIIGIFLLSLAVWVLYFEFNLEKLAKTVTQISQLLAVVGGAALVKFDTGGAFFGTRAAVMNVLVLTLGFVFVSALVAAFLLREQRR
jgi:hypothetical protein